MNESIFKIAEETAKKLNLFNDLTDPNYYIAAQESRINVIHQALIQHGNDRLEAAVHIVMSLPILADHEKECCGDIPEMMLRKDIAEAIRALKFSAEGKL